MNKETKEIILAILCGILYVVGIIAICVFYPHLTLLATTISILLVDICIEKFLKKP